MDPLDSIGDAPAHGLDLEVRGKVPAAPDRVWEALFEPASLSAWLRPRLPEPGAGAAFPGSGPGEGAAHRSGAVHVLEPRRHLRMTWHPEGWSGPATLHVRVAAGAADGSVVVFRQERVPGQAARDERRAVLRDALERLAARLGSG